MAQPRPVPEGGFSYTWDPSVAALGVSRKDFLSTRTPVMGSITGALVFSKVTGPDRILLIQRAAHDSMPLRWEIPGGACDDEDATLFYGLARELWEEAGLRLKRVVRQVGAESTFFTRRGLPVVKITFETEVEGSSTPDGLAEVTLDANEHVRFLWATEDECRLGKVAVLGKSGEHEAVNIEFTTKAQKSIILLGFQLRREGIREAQDQ